MNQNFPKITIITPTYKRPRMLAEAMESVLKPGYPNLQYIIVDDNSPDDTEAVVRGFMERYPGVITYLRNDKNGGESASINRAWLLAEGRYLAILSDDDKYLPNWYDITVPFMESRPDVIVGYPDWYIIDENSNVLTPKSMPEYSFINMFAKCHSTPGPGVLIRMSALKGMDRLRPPYVFLADYALWLILSTKGLFAHIPHITVCWRQHQQSTTVSNNSIKKVAELDQMAEDFLNKYAAIPLVAVNRRKIRTRVALQGFLLISRDRDWQRAFTYLLRAISLSPYWACILAGCFIRRSVDSCRLKWFHKSSKIT